jgi:hypothetical protein
MREIQREITDEKLAKYFDVSTRARDKVVKLNPKLSDEATDMLNMINCYIADAHHFKEKGDYINAFAALNYAHGWLDAGARLEHFFVDGDDVLFTVDGKD